MWNEEPYSANLIPVIFVFTFVYSIILYAFSKVIEGNVLVFNCMTKMSCFRSDRGVIEENVLYHCLWRLNINSYNLRSDRVIEDLQKTSYANHNLGKFWCGYPGYFDGKYIVIKDGRSSIFPISFQQKRIPCNHWLQGIVFCLLRSSQRESRWTFFNFITLVLIFTACSPSRGNWSIRTESCKSWCVPGIPHDES